MPFIRYKLEYHGNAGHTLGSIQHIPPISGIDICPSTYCLATQTVAPTFPGFQRFKQCVKYLASRPHKTILYP